jgi:hypothetical protein
LGLEWTVKQVTESRLGHMKAESGCDDLKSAVAAEVPGAVAFVKPVVVALDAGQRRIGGIAAAFACSTASSPNSPRIIIAAALPTKNWLVRASS